MTSTTSCGTLRKTHTGIHFESRTRTRFRDTRSASWAHSQSETLAGKSPAATSRIPSSSTSCSHEASSTTTSTGHAEMFVAMRKVFLRPVGTYKTVTAYQSDNDAVHPAKYPISIGSGPCEIQVVVLDASLPMAKSKRAKPRIKYWPTAKQPSKKTRGNRLSKKSQDAKALTSNKVVPMKKAKAAKKPKAIVKRATSPKKSDGYTDSTKEENLSGSAAKKLRKK